MCVCVSIHRGCHVKWSILTLVIKIYVTIEGIWISLTGSKQGREKPGGRQPKFFSETLHPFFFTSFALIKFV